MSYFVVVSLDLQDAHSVDHESIHMKMSDLGFSKTLRGSDGRHYTLPTAVYAGEFKGSDTSMICNENCERIRNALIECQANAKIFLTVGRDWSWAVSPS